MSQKHRVGVEYLRKRRENVVAPVLAFESISYPGLVAWTSHTGKARTEVLGQIHLLVQRKVIIVSSVRHQAFNIDNGCVSYLSIHTFPPILSLL